MLLRPSNLHLPTSRRSPTALVTVTALHLALLWLINQHWPVERAVRYVVYQYVKPISASQDTAASSRAISVSSALSLRSSTDLPVFSNTVDPTVPLKATNQLPDTVRAPEQTQGPRNRPPLAQAAAEPEAAPTPATATPQPAPVPPALVPPVPAPAVPVVEPVVTPPVPTPVVVPAPAPVPVPVPAPAPLLAPVPAPIPAPAPLPQPAPVLTPAVVPEPVPPAPVPAPAAPAARPVEPARTEAPRPVQRLQAPVLDVPVPANSPAAVGATTVPVLVPPGVGTGTSSAGQGTQGGPGGPPGGSPSGSLGPAGGAGPAGAARPGSQPAAPLILPYSGPLHPGPYRVQPRQRSLADMANEQLRRGKPRDPLAEGMEASGVDDCMHQPKGTPTVGGLLAAPGLVGRALSDKCAK